MVFTKDNIKLIKTLKTFKSLANTVLVVETDEETIRASDYIIDVGPKAGVNGAEIVSKEIKEYLKAKNLLLQNI